MWGFFGGLGEIWLWIVIAVHTRSAPKADGLLYRVFGGLSLPDDQPSWVECWQDCLAGYLLRRALDPGHSLSLFCYPVAVLLLCGRLVSMPPSGLINQSVASTEVQPGNQFQNSFLESPPSSVLPLAFLTRPVIHDSGFSSSQALSGSWRSVTQT